MKNEAKIKINRETAICPITFINNKEGNISSSTDVNSMFTNAYDSKIVTDFSHSMMIDSIKNDMDEKDPKNISWAVRMNDIDTQSNYDAIMSYLVTNITDLTYSTLLKFLSNTMIPMNNIVGTFMDDKFINIDIRNIVVESIISSGLPMVFPGLPIQQQYVAIDSAMGSVYSYLVAIVFDRYIVDHVMVAFTTNDGINDLFNALYYACYDEDPTNIPDPVTTYSFCTSIMREKMEECLCDFRQALMMVSRTVAAMACNLPDYATNILDKNYNTGDLVESNDGIKKIFIKTISSATEEQ